MFLIKRKVQLCGALLTLRENCTFICVSARERSEARVSYGIAGADQTKYHWAAQMFALRVTLIQHKPQGMMCARYRRRRPINQRQKVTDTRQEWSHTTCDCKLAKNQPHICWRGEVHAEQVIVLKGPILCKSVHCFLYLLHFSESRMSGQR